MEKYSAPLVPDQPEETAEKSPAQLLEERFDALAQQLTQRFAQSAALDAERAQALSDREARLSRQELAAFSRGEMEKRGLPCVLSECLVFADQDAVVKGADALEECFRAQVQLAVEERLLDGAPKTASMRPLNEMTDEEYYAAAGRIN